MAEVSPLLVGWITVSCGLFLVSHASLMQALINLEIMASLSNDYCETIQNAESLFCSVQKYLDDSFNAPWCQSFSNLGQKEEKVASSL